MRFDVITMFPRAFDSYLGESMIKRARAKKILDIRVHDLRAFSRDKKHKKVDDRPYGGGPGMVMQIEPLARAIAHLKLRGKKTKVILFTAGGTQFNASSAREFAKKYDHIVLIAGHYEGVDERIVLLVRDFGFRLEEISVGPYVLTGGELPAMILIDAVARHIPQFLGKAESLEEARYGVGIPVYTRPEIFLWRGKKYRVPNVLLSGHTANIAAWRKKFMHHG